MYLPKCSKQVREQTHVLIKSAKSEHKRRSQNQFRNELPYPHRGVSRSYNRAQKGNDRRLPCAWSWLQFGETFPHISKSFESQGGIEVYVKTCKCEPATCVTHIVRAVKTNVDRTVCQRERERESWSNNKKTRLLMENKWNERKHRGSQICVDARWRKTLETKENTELKYVPTNKHRKDEVSKLSRWQRGFLESKHTNTQTQTQTRTQKTKKWDNCPDTNTNIYRKDEVRQLSRWQRDFKKAKTQTQKQIQT